VKFYQLDLGNRNIFQAQCLLGELYFEGRGFVKDEKKSVEWIGKASQQHDDGGAIEKWQNKDIWKHKTNCEMNETSRR
jgi:TPR repeat protein